MGKMLVRSSAATRTVVLGWALALSLACVGCAFLSHYDPTSYKNATDLKAEALVLVERAIDPPTQHQAEIDGLRVRLRQAYEYEAGKGRPNHLTRDQWKLLIDPKGNLLGGFLAKWERENKGQSHVFVEQIDELVSKAFDQIIQLEVYKVKD
jgi:hypothetical protein